MLFLETRFYRVETTGGGVTATIYDKEWEDSVFLQGDEAAELLATLDAVSGTDVEQARVFHDVLTGYFV
jgi:hypothetical protein